MNDLAAPETPNRDHDTENFPTASLILAKPVRAKVMAFYRFVRMADDIADSPSLSPAEKIARLDAMEAALDDPRTDLAVAAKMHREQVGTDEARLMLAAFRQDSEQRRYANWTDLEDYCTRSADPVGRMLLRLHGTDSAEARHAADGLSTALQILNHLQDLVTDRDGLDRVYLPQSWLDLAGGEEAFFEPGNTRRREILDAALDRVEDQLDRAAALPHLVASRRLRLQSAMTLGLARRLLAKLRTADPVLGRVALGKPEMALAGLAAPFPAPSDAQVVAARVSRAGSSFARGMATLKGDRRRALWGVYAFCRVVDDIADGRMPEEEKRRLLAGWRAKLTTPDCALSRELLWARETFDIPYAECDAMIAGMETDAGDRVRLPDQAALDLYCRRVAGSVGAMSVRIFGDPKAEGWGLALGHTFQLTNILRDVDEDAVRDRVYIPLSVLKRAGIPDGPAKSIVEHPAFPGICKEIAGRATAGYFQAEAVLPRYNTEALRPARVMMWGYRRILDHMMARGWSLPRVRARLTKGEKIRMAVFAVTGR
ncbi:squalene/phytoene synthase family protein [Roseococcus sp.]|uniref:squalene/phytoene synthase family protein n=1 Tax=Roseococcus sp. TaxID=2109646 RepID=UPI003BABB057